MSGCTVESEEYAPETKKSVLGTTFTEYRIPEEVKKIFLEEVITGFFEVDDTYYVVYNNETDQTIVTLDSDFNILHEIEGFGYVSSIEKKNKEHIIVEHHRTTTFIDILDEEGYRVISMDVSFHFSTLDEQFGSSYSYLGGGYYLYVKELELDTVDRAFQLIKTNGVIDDVLYEFNSQYTHRVFVLEDGSIVFRFKEKDEKLDTFVHMNENGNIILEEKVNFMDLTLLSDGYLLETFAGDFSYGYFRRDFDSEQVWKYVSNNFLSSPEEREDSIFFRVNSRDNIKEMEIMDNGLINVIVPEDKPLFVEYRRDYVTDDSFIHVDYQYNPDGLCTFELYSKDEELLYSIDYTYRINHQINDSLFYVYGMDGNNSIIDVFKLDGNLVRKDSVIGEIIYIKENGNYIVLLESGIVQELKHNGDVVWEIDKGFSLVSFVEINDNIFIISNVVNFCPMLSSTSCPRYSPLIIDNEGNVLADYMEDVNTYLVYQDQTYFYMYSQYDKHFYIYDYEANLVDEYDIILGGGTKYLTIREGKLVVIEFPELITNLRLFPY